MARAPNFAHNSAGPTGRTRTASAKAYRPHRCASAPKGMIRGGVLGGAAHNCEDAAWTQQDRARRNARCIVEECNGLGGRERLHESCLSEHWHIDGAGRLWLKLFWF